MRQLRLRMPDESVQSVTVDENQPVANLMVIVCTKLGITNSDEYSLVSCASKYSTIDGRRREVAKVEGRIYDQKMEQLKKKLKTDEDLAWLDHSKTLDEQGVHSEDVVLLRRKFFYSDHSVDSRDPLQLNLLYAQTRDAILAGTHPVTVDGACRFAGLQAQAQFGNFIDGKTNRPGFVNIKNLLPIEYGKIKHIERKVFAEHRKHYGLGELEAKARYVSESRSLPTYGVTFFLVKEKVAGKSRLVPRLLGVTRDCVMRVDADTKGVLKTWPLTTVKRWAASVNSFTLDFGDYADAYYSVQTSEGEQISQLIAGYIDIILKRKKAKDHFGIDGDEGATMIEDSVAPSRATILTNVPTLPRPAPAARESELEIEEEPIASVAGPRVEMQRIASGPYVERGEFRPAVEVRGSAEVGFESKPLTQFSTNYELSLPQRDLQNKLSDAQEAVESAQRVLDKQQVHGSTTHAHEQVHQQQGTNSMANVELEARRRKLENEFANINAATAQLVSLSAIPEEELDYPELNAAVEQVASSLPAVARDVQAVAALLPSNDDSAEQLVDAARRLCTAFSDLLLAAEPGPTVPRQSLISAASRVGDATQALLSAIGSLNDNYNLQQQQLSTGDQSLGTWQHQTTTTTTTTTLTSSEQTTDTLLTLAKSVANAAAALVLRSKGVASDCDNNSAGAGSEAAADSVIGAATQCALATSQMVATAKIVASTVADRKCKQKLLDSCNEVARATDGIQVACARALARCPDRSKLAAVNESVERVSYSLDELISFVNSLEPTIQRHNQQQQQQQQQQYYPQQTNQHQFSSSATNLRFDDTSIQDSTSSQHQNRELVKQARTLANATTQLIEDIQQQQQQPLQQQPVDNRRSFYESETHNDQYEAFKRQQQQVQPQAFSNQSSTEHYYRGKVGDNNGNQQHNSTSRTTTTTTKTTTTRAESSARPVVTDIDSHIDITNKTTSINNNDDDDNNIDGELNDQQQQSQLRVFHGEHEAAEATISGIISDLDTTIVFASSGSLKPLQANHDTYGYHRENMLKTAKALVEDTKRLVTSAAGDERQLASAARDSVITVGKLAEAVKAGAASLGSSSAESQVSLIRSARDVASSLSGLISSTKVAHRQDASDDSMTQVKDSAKNIVTSVTSLLRTVKSVEDEHERGCRAIETAIESIDNEIVNYDSQCSLAEQLSNAERNQQRARPDQLVKAGKPMTLAAAKTLAAATSGRQDDAVLASSVGRKALAELLNTTKFVSFNADDRELRSKVQQAGKQCALSYKQLLNTVHEILQRPAAVNEPQVKQQLAAESQQLASKIHELVSFAAPLRNNGLSQAQSSSKSDLHVPPVARLDQLDDNNSYNNQDANNDADEASNAAVSELLGAASSIDAAARKLENLKPRTSSIKLPHEELNFDEIILDAAKCIIEATAALLRAASASQRELLVDGRLDETETFYAPDHNQWSEGLVSAARMVAAATHSLVEAANALVQGHASEERLISAAKQVASSTNQLIVACKVRADPDSNTISRLSNAGNAVKRATDNLVRASQQAIEHDEEQSLVISNRKVSGIAQEISAREQILRKEKELQVAKTQLMAIRKAKYSNRPDDYQGYGGSLD